MFVFSGDFMSEVKINQPIKVLAKFISGKLLPCKFDYKGRLYEIEAINGSYLLRKGKFPLYFFSVQTKQSADLFELVFSFEDLTWILKKIVNEDFI